MMKEEKYTLITKLAFYSIFTFFSLPYSSLKAETPLEDILNSPVLKGMDQDNKKGSAKANLDEFLDPNTNYATIFLTKEPNMLLDWLNHREKTLPITKEVVGDSDEYAYSERDYTSGTNKNIKVQLFIPHPRYMELTEENLLIDLAKLEPPRLEIKYSEPIEINNQEGVVYHHKDSNNNEIIIKDQCSILFKLTKQSRVNILGTCKDLDDFKKIARSLTFERLIEKLNS